MTENSFKIPFYAKSALIFISAFAFVYIMFIGQDIIVPLVYATIFAILLNPFVNLLIRKKVPKLIAISIAVTLTLFIVLVILYFLISRINMFSESYPALKIKLTQTIDQLVRWIAHEFNYSRVKIHRWISVTESETIERFATRETLSQMGGFLVTLVLIPVYLFMILYYKSLLLEFVRKLFRLEHHTAVVEVLRN